MSNDVNKIIVWTNPTAPFQKIYVMKEGILVDQVGVKVDDVKDVVYALADKYSIFDINFSGAPSYGEKIAKDIENGQIIRYDKSKITVTFV